MKVFISSSSRVEEAIYLKIAKDVSEVLIENNCELVCGGVASGMMKQIFEEFNKRNVHTICVTLDIYKEDLSEVSESYLVDDTFDRAKKIYELMDIALFLPGGTGSLEELLAMLEESRTLIGKPLILYNVGGHFNKVLEILNDFIRLGFNSENILEKICVVSSLNELEEKIKNITGGNRI